MKTYSFVYVINTMEFEEELERLITVDLPDETSLEVLVYDTLCDEESTEYVNKYKNWNHLENITLRFFDKPDYSVTECWDDALSLVTGEFVNFSRSTVYVNNPRGILARLNAVRDSEEEQYEVISAEPYQMMDEKATYQLYFKQRNYRVDFEEQYYRINLEVESLFFSRELIGNTRFGKSACLEKSRFFAAEMYKRAGKYYLIRGRIYFTEYMAKDPYNYSLMYDKDWYTKELKNYILPAIKKNKESYVYQAAMLHMIQTKLSANLNDRNKTLLNEKEIDEFFEVVSEIFQEMDDVILVQNSFNHKKMLQRFMGVNYLRLKYHKDQFPLHTEWDEEREDWVVKYNDLFIEQLKMINCRVLAINYEKEELVFDIELANVHFTDHSEIQAYIVYGGERHAVEKTSVYALTKYFGRSVKKGYMFCARIPKSAFARKANVHFEVDYDGHTVQVPCDFVKIQARLNLKPGAYWNFGDGILTYKKKKKVFKIRKSFGLSVFRHELDYRWKFLFGAIRHGKGRRLALQSWKLRADYFRTKRKYKGEVWVTFDQLFKGGDNGEYFFRYMNEHHPEVKMYYIVNEDSEEFETLNALYPGMVLPFKSYKSRLVSLHATMIFATRVDVKLYCGFDAKDEKFIRDLFNAKVVCLQHGLTMQNIAQYQNRLFDNLRYYYCVSPVEIKNINRPIYGYDDSMISLTGAPRYDGLKGEPKKQILISPTWRRNVTAGTNEKGKNHEYSSNFKNTVYYQVYNGLINNKKLLECAKETGYKLIYLIHPILSPQIDDFDKNDYLEIRPGANINYEQILKETSLMVTDYSGIMYDFSYMRRPLIYYHPEVLPPQYGEGIATYEEMGIGIICKTEEAVVDALCEAMRNDCKIDEARRASIDKFFPYDDQNSCERVYEATMKWLGDK